MALSRSRLCTLAALTSALHCNGQSFSSGSESASGGKPPNAGHGGAGRDGGRGGRGSGGNGTGKAGNATGESGSAGEGGSPTDAGAAGIGTGGQSEGGAGGEASCREGSTCPPGTYCGEQGDCRSCGDITTLGAAKTAKFGAPEAFSLLNEAAGDFMLRTPRAFGSKGALLYVRDFFGGEIWLTGDAERDVGAPLPSPVNQPDFVEGSPLWLASSDDPFLPFNFIFNHAKDSMSAYELEGAVVAMNGTASELARLPAPLNPAEPFAESVYSLAVSRDRAWWMVNRDGGLALQFLTAPLDGSGPPSVVALRDASDCGVFEFDLSAWVTQDGKLLFVNAVERTSDCAPLPGEPHDILVFELDESGHAVGPGVPFPGVSVPTTNEIDGSLSSDQCTVYFVTDVAGKLRLMQARRTS